MDQIFEAAQTVLSLSHFAYLMMGVVVGLIVAILPGLGGTAGLALVLPFVFGMDQSSALAVMIGLLAITATGDTFPSVLMGIPGSSASQATVIDGFPMARQGKAAMALSAAFGASLIGGVIGALVLTGAMFAAQPLIRMIGFGEQLLLVVLALTMVSMLSGKSMLKGLAAAGFGLLLGSIGAAPGTGEVRFAFSTNYLLDGIPLVVFSLGIFAIPEIVDLLRSRGTISSSALGEGWREGLLAVRRNFGLVLRCSGLGCVIGALPGLGGSVVDWLAYGHAQQTVKQDPRFGEGDVRGVIAPESANNAVRGGELIPTLFFGIPGSGSMALLLGGFVLIGLQPGLPMITRDLDITYTIIWSLAAANVLGAFLCIGLAPQISKLTRVPYSNIGPVILAIIVFTAYQATESWGDMIGVFLLGCLGILMKRFEWPRPALVIGFVLAHGLEGNFYRTAQVYGLDFLGRTQSLVILGLIAVSLILGIRVVRASRKPGGPGGFAPARRLPQISFTLGLLAVVGYTLIEMQGAKYLTYLFPVSVGVITGVILLLVLARQVLSDSADPILTDAEQSDTLSGVLRPGVGRYLGWFVILMIAVLGLGYTIGAALFLVAFISAEIGWRPMRALLLAGGTIAALTALAYFFALSYPEGWLPLAINAPWWLQ